MKISDKKTWNIRKFNKKDKIIGVFDSSSNLVGYMIYRLKNLPTGEWDVALVFREIITLTRDSFYTVLNYIKKHTDQIIEFQWPLLSNELSFSNFYEKYNVKIETKPQTMFRVIDVEKALEAINYRKDIDTSITLEVADKHAEWNNTTFEVKIKDGKASVERKPIKEVDLFTDINSFTQLFSGYLSIKQLQYMSKVKVKEEKIAVINELFPTTPTKVLTHF